MIAYILLFLFVTIGIFNLIMAACLNIWMKGQFVTVSRPGRALIRASPQHPLLRRLQRPCVFLGNQCFQSVPEAVVAAIIPRTIAVSTNCNGR